MTVPLKNNKPLNYADVDDCTCEKTRPTGGSLVRLQLHSPSRVLSQPSTAPAGSDSASTSIDSDNECMPPPPPAALLCEQSIRQLRTATNQPSDMGHKSMPTTPHHAMHASGATTLDRKAYANRCVRVRFLYIFTECQIAAIHQPATASRWVTHAGRTSSQCFRTSTTLSTR